jgi:hypothetical protein
VRGGCVDLWTPIVWCLCENSCYQHRLFCCCKHVSQFTLSCTSPLLSFLILHDVLLSFVTIYGAFSFLFMVFIFALFLAPCAVCSCVVRFIFCVYLFLFICSLFFVSSSVLSFLPSLFYFFLSSFVFPSVLEFRDLSQTWGLQLPAIYVINILE